MKKESSFKMKGFSGFGNSPMKAKASAAENLLKAVPNKKAYEKLSDIDKKGFDKAAKKAGLPTKKSPAKLDPNDMKAKVFKSGEFKDIISKKPANAAQKSFRNFKNAAKPSPRGKMATGRVGRKIAAKIGGKLLGPIGAAITARDAYKSYKDIKGGMKIGKALKKNFLGL